ncbi:MAG: hypothetical protein R3C19_25580, partial [Planctomycetaceae bacterium]
RNGRVKQLSLCIGKFSSADRLAVASLNASFFPARGITHEPERLILTREQYNLPRRSANPNCRGRFDSRCQKITL